MVLPPCQAMLLRQSKLICCVGLLAIGSVMFSCLLKLARMSVENKSNTILPLCRSDELLNRKNFFSDPKSEDWMSFKPNKECQLNSYGKEDLAICLDALVGRTGRPLHVALVGDSRIRQLFYGFIWSIPDYDQEVVQEGFPVATKDYISPLQIDQNLTSHMLNLRVSFHWRRLIDDKLMRDVNQWMESSTSDPPDVLLIGIAAHHMLISNGADHWSYEERLTGQLLPALGRLADLGTRVIWMMQYPTIEMFANNGDSNTDVHSSKIHQYNQFFIRNQHIIQEMKIQVWDSASLFVEEYIRACNLGNNRSEVVEDVFYGPVLKQNSGYIICVNYIHPGYVVLLQNLQILFNYMCNPFVES